MCKRPQFSPSSVSSVIVEIYRVTGVDPGSNPRLHWLQVAARIRLKMLVLSLRSENGSGQSDIKDVVGHRQPSTPTTGLVERI